jgi:hypothetical protein
MRKQFFRFSFFFALSFFLTGCFSATKSTITEYREDGSIAKVTQSGESVIKTLTESTRKKTVIAWESGWLAYISVSAATLEDPTPTVKLFAGKSDKGAISALPNQKNWDGIAKTILATKQDLSVTADGITNTSSTVQE